MQRQAEAAITSATSVSSSKENGDTRERSLQVHFEGISIPGTPSSVIIAWWEKNADGLVSRVAAVILFKDAGGNKNASGCTVSSFLAFAWSLAACTEELGCGLVS